MNLRQYLEKRKESAAVFARRIGTSRQAVHNYMAGRVPAPDLVTAIQDATEGAVQPNDWYPRRKSSTSDGKAA